MAQTLNEARTIELGLEDKDGRAYVGRINGTTIAYDDAGSREIAVYLTNDERVLVYDVARRAYHRIDDPAEGSVSGCP